MNIAKVSMIVLTAALPIIGFGKSKLKTLYIGDTVLEPEDSLTFTLEDEPEYIGGYEVLSEYLPGGIEVTWTGKKFKLPKAGKVKYSKKEGDFVTTRDDNPCGLKLSISKKSGKVKGSFKVYVVKSEKKLKSYSASVSGYLGGTLLVKIKKHGTYGALLD